MESVYIHQVIDGVMREAEVAPSTVPHYMQYGWSEGRAPDNEVADEQVRRAEEAAAAAAAADADATAVRQAEEAAAAGATVDAFGKPLAPQIAARHRDEVSPQGDEAQPSTTPEEGH